MWYAVQFDYDPTPDVECEVEPLEVGPDGPQGGPITDGDKYVNCTWGFYRLKDFEIGYDYLSVMHYHMKA